MADGGGNPDDVRRLDAATLCRFATAPCITHTEDGRPKRGASIDKVKMSLRAFFRYLTEAGVLYKNPSAVLKYGRDHRVPETLNWEERECLLNALDQAPGWRGKRDAALVALLLGTGIRLSSLVGLDVTDLSLGGRALALGHELANIGRLPLTPGACWIRRHGSDPASS